MRNQEKCNLLDCGRVVMRPTVNRRPYRRWFEPNQSSKLHLNIREVNQTGSGLALKAMGTVSSRMEFDSTILPPS